VRATSAVALADPAPKLVHALKYGGWEALAATMADRMAVSVREVGSGDAVVPVPTTRRRVRDRGYNQAERLASALADRLELPLIEAVDRRGEAGTQVHLGPSERRANVRSAFCLKDEASAGLAGRQLLVVDDVLMTGATVAAVATTLERAGISGVTVVTFARAITAPL